MSRKLVTAALSLALVGSLSAQERLPTKELAGPIEEVQTGVMAQVKPIETAIHSKSAMIPVQLTQNADGTWAWNSQIAVEGPDLEMVLFSGEESWSVELGEGHSKSLQPAHELAARFERTSLEMGNDAFGGDHYEFAQVQPGKWSVAVETDSTLTGQGYLLYSSETPYRLLSYKATTDSLVGREITFLALAYDKALEGRQTRSQGGLLDEVQLRVTAPDGHEWIQNMYDDGLHGDRKAGDGLFGGSFLAEMEGDYNAQVIARGTTPQGVAFERTAQHVFPVVMPRVHLTRDFAESNLVDNKRLQVSLAVDNSEGAPEKYRVFAEVWGANADGVMEPVNWIGGMSYVENGRLSLGLDLRWIGLSNARDGFELRNVRLEDPNTFVPVLRQEHLRLETPILPSMAQFATKSLDAEMLMGPRPARTGFEKAGGRLLLVHGYCSGDAWGPVSGQFTNDSVFLDTNQNRSHDQFAVLVGTFGSAYSSFGIVAHSQGGAAALHLYTYYWSGLDFASGGRLIQSVGTPYQGTALAGNAAVLGQIFGIGCGTNTDLTYSGASSWLSGIPTWARNAVNYYTTSFKDRWWAYDYCNLVTDLLLSDPDDGTTERAKGQLSSGVNRGHKTGWCHTSGMRDPSQVTDSSRNSSMNSNAAN